jgi:hypothetical protein
LTSNPLSGRTGGHVPVGMKSGKAAAFKSYYIRVNLNLNCLLFGVCPEPAALPVGCPLRVRVVLGVTRPSPGRGVGWFVFIRLYISTIRVDEFQPACDAKATARVLHCSVQVGPAAAAAARRGPGRRTGRTCSESASAPHVPHRTCLRWHYHDHQPERRGPSRQSGGWVGGVVGVEMGCMGRRGR